MGIRKPKSWGQIKPPVGYGVDWSDPINKDLRGCWLFNEGAGNKAFDVTGNFNKAALGTGQTWVTGNLNCSGSSNEATVSASPSINIVGNFSGSVWVYPKVSNVYQTLFSRSTASNGINRQYAMLLSGNGTGQIYIALGGTDIGNVVVSPGYTANKWNHIVLTADGTNARIYINRVLANTTATIKVPTNNATFPLSIGAEGSGFPLNGLLGQERFANRVWSQAEIDRLYAEPYVGIITPRRRLWTGGVASTGRTLSAAITEANDVFTALVQVAIKISGSVTEANDIFAASAQVAVKLSAAMVEANDSLAGTLSGASRTVSAAIIEANDAMAAAVKVAVKLTSNATEANDLLAAIFKVAVKLSMAVTEANDSMLGTINPPTGGGIIPRLTAIASINRLLTKG